MYNIQLLIKFALTYTNLVDIIYSPRTVFFWMAVPMAKQTKKNIFALQKLQRVEDIFVGLYVGLASSELSINFLKCGSKYTVHCGNSLSHFFDKIFVKVTVLLIKEVTKE